MAGFFPLADCRTGNQPAGQQDLVRLEIALTELVPTEPPSHPRDPLLRDYYEEILNGLVYELYLPEELHGAGLRFFDLVAAADLPEIAAGGKARPADQLARLRDKFEELYAPAHPLRAALEKLHILEPVRIIEGKT